MRVVGLYDSVRQRSLSAALPRAFRQLAPAAVRVEPVDRTGALLPFGPFAELALAPAALALRAAVTTAHARRVVRPSTRTASLRR